MSKIVISFNNDEFDILNCLIKNEIESNTDYINDVEDLKEKNYWKNLIVELENMLIKLNKLIIFKKNEGDKICGELTTGYTFAKG